MVRVTAIQFRMTESCRDVSPPRLNHLGAPFVAGFALPIGCVGLYVKTELAWKSA